MAWHYTLFPRGAHTKCRATDRLLYFWAIALLAAVHAGGNLGFEQPNISSRALDATCPNRDLSDIQLEYMQYPVCLEPKWAGIGHVENYTSNSSSGGADIDASIPPGASPSPSSTVTATTSGSSGLDQDLDTESPLDNANFLSFEEWKKQNLAKVGQSVDHVRGDRQGAGSEASGRRQRPMGIDNSLDSLGEDGEIALEFGGFGPENSGPASWERKVGKGQAPHADGAESATRGAEGETQIETTTRGGVSKRKDAGTTCKERFNYASFDCAATVLKTNPQCSGASSVLTENKDNYMLNECRARDKFLIVELCDDILIDTIVLANYEFFSSIFRTFRVSVSDRYPPKQPDMWRELGTYEAVNSREVQAFAVENPLIWARYVKIEFLTHYGNEFYCPVSLIRVHGTTMLEEYKNDGEASRLEDHNSAQIQGNVASESGPDNPAANQSKVVGKESDGSTGAGGFDVQPTRVQKPEDICLPKADIGAILSRSLAGEEDGVCLIKEAPRAHNQSMDAVQSASVQAHGPAKVAEDATPITPSAESSSNVASPTQKTTPTVTDSRAQNPANESQHATSTSTHKTEYGGSSESSKPSTTVQQHQPNPTTQESFFKSVNKRLHMLETNSSLSLQYIEEQSRILRDAFSKVEKRQLAKTTTFLENLNTSVLQELREFRHQYDQVWHSVAVEFEQQRLHYHQEVFAMSSQLGILADELLFQKRISIIQSVFVLICFGLVLFSRSSIANYLELPRVHTMVSRSQSYRSSTHSFESPSASPSSRPNSSYRDSSKDASNTSHRRTHSVESVEDDLAVNPTIAYSPPTPTSDSDDHGLHRQGSQRSDSTASSIMVTQPPQLLRSESSPPDLRGPSEGSEGSEGRSLLEAPQVSS
ncbi:Sad1/UNC domain-containing protein [Blastomyces gilchristii SLH14081]|uniref:Sad1/UNC domain-containing protein n=1 Tax=Blastomyces gilchristii (strain SLH14081) TaxID=559298 RepID=A0A179UID4_BLAGS|nr:Sad1/UNC domain-containing protein [Blastomyces gilchristii SLH14081]OAT07620.1 Sad1/UNC domain-containing protein [Blastomyces gilchristii SLH14081]